MVLTVAVATINAVLEVVQWYKRLSGTKLQNIKRHILCSAYNGPSAIWRWRLAPPFLA